MDSDLDLTYFEKGGFDLDLNFVGFDLKNLKSTQNPSLVRRVNFVTQMLLQRYKYFGTLLEIFVNHFPPTPKE